MFVYFNVHTISALTSNAYDGGLPHFAHVSLSILFINYAWKIHCLK